MSNTLNLETTCSFKRLREINFTLHQISILWLNLQFLQWHFSVLVLCQIIEITQRKVIPFIHLTPLMKQSLPHWSVKTRPHRQLPHGQRINLKHIQQIRLVHTLTHLDHDPLIRKPRAVEPIPVLHILPSLIHHNLLHPPPQILIQPDHHQLALPLIYILTHPYSLIIALIKLIHLLPTRIQQYHTEHVLILELRTSPLHIDLHLDLTRTPQQPWLHTVHIHRELPLGHLKTTHSLFPLKLRAHVHLPVTRDQVPVRPIIHSIHQLQMVLRGYPNLRWEYLDLVLPEPKVTLISRMNLSADMAIVILIEIASPEQSKTQPSLLNLPHCHIRVVNPSSIRASPVDVIAYIHICLSVSCID